MIKITRELLSNWFKEFNRLYFDGEIKREPKYITSTNKSRYGQFSPRQWTIEISTAYVRSERDYINTFLHELCHVYVREKYGTHVQSHGYEWKSIAEVVTNRTYGKYGIIKRVGGGLDKSVLRKANGASKYIVFTDFNGRLSISKYSNEEYVRELIAKGGVMDGTEIRYYISSNVDMETLKARRTNCRYLRWSYSRWSLDEIDKMATLVSKNIYHKFNRAA